MISLFHTLVLLAIIFSPTIVAFAPNANTFGLVTASSPESYARHVVGDAKRTSPATALSLIKSPSDSGDVGYDVTGILDSALNADTAAVSTLLDKISALRQSNAQQELTAYLDNILAVVDECKKPFWTKFRFTSKVSKRSRRVALHRVLNISTPSAPGDDDTEEAKKSRRRRALVVALRSLLISESSSEEESEKVLKGVSIYNIEKAARKDLNDEFSAQDLEARMPPGLETPKYDVIVKRPKYEIRKYESFSVCSVPMSRPRPDASSTDQKVSQPQLAGASSFGALGE